MALNATVYSPQMGQKMVWLSGLLPYEQWAVVFEQIGERLIPASSVWRQTQRPGERLQAYVEQQREQVSVERVVLPDAQHDHDQRKAVSLDGGMVNIRGEGWKELKVGSIGRIERHWTADTQVVKLNDLHYVGIVGDVARFKNTFWELAVRRGAIYAGHTVVTADGAAWIGRLVADLFPCSVQIVDWYHASQHLAQAAADRYPADANAAHDWQKPLRALLFQGHIEPIIAALKAVAAGKHQGYFKEHKRRMQYQEFWEMGYPIGSGAVESGIKQFKQRLTGPGMRWSRRTIEHMVLLRASALSRTFDDLWRAA